MSNQWTPPLDTRREEQKRKESIQRNSSSVQKILQQSLRTNNIEGEWGQDLHSNPIGCSLLPVHDQFKLPKEEKNKEKSQETAEITFSAPRPNKDKEENKEKNKGKSQELSETGGITLSAPRPNLPMDNYNGTRSQQSTTYSQRFLESKPGKYYQPCIWCIGYSSRLGKQERIVQNPARERQIPSSSGPVWECDSETGKVGVRELLGDECLDLFMPVETRSPNQVSNNNSIQKENNGTMQKLQSYSELVDRLKNDCEFREFHGPTDNWLIGQENREFFSKKYGITSIDPLLMIVVLCLCGVEMERGMQILGINKLEGLANYLYHPDKICAVMKDTGELVPEVELTRRVTEKLENKKLEKKKLAEKNREKRLAKKKRLAEQKRLAEEKRVAEKKKSGLRIET
ncbi:hypothetical protein C1645_807622 [Glomus cerebriforme]|uniref:Uncharacterized protein n=1 Tax=Glomus cerebriforme TaxID=658196 RepID=A0A397SV66_9GLOM|nr:hypothetical protein C1645_807622 [Glomus cerebriforme]